MFVTKKKFGELDREIDKYKLHVEKNLDELNDRIVVLKDKLYYLLDHLGLTIWCSKGEYPPYHICKKTKKK